MINLEVWNYIIFKNSKEIYLIEDKDTEEVETIYYLQSPEHFSYSWWYNEEYLLENATNYKPGFIEAIILYFKLKNTW